MSGCGVVPVRLASTLPGVTRLALLIERNPAMLCALFLVPIPGIGHEMNGARRWLNLGVSIQPSEFLKPGFIALCAWFMASAQAVGGPPGRLYSFFVAAAVIVAASVLPHVDLSPGALRAVGVVEAVALCAIVPLAVGAMEVYSLVRQR